MDQKAIMQYLKKNFRVITFFIVFALVQFYFFWGLAHLMPGERFYQRVARIKAGGPPPAPIVDPVRKSQVPDWKR